jgi:glycosyltransferase involved in cell wall biosynthesis
LWTKREELAKISICIPAYKRPANIQRLLQSIAGQSFRDFEVVITDDSPDDSVRQAIADFGSLPIRYEKNALPLGTPSNWNRGISLAKGEWIKMMHDDDWFADENSLQIFADSTASGKAFIFSRYYNVFSSGKKILPAFPAQWKRRIVRHPMTLLSKNVIGPPSVTMIHHSIREQYDSFMKWRVDIDYYVRILSKEKSFELIDRPLIHVGISDSQVTNDCINEPGVELPEGLLLLNKYSVSPLKHILVYDAWWRILRNTGMRSREQLANYTPYGQWPAVISRMVAEQARIPASLLKNGVISKSAMALSYLSNKKFLDN